MTSSQRGQKYSLINAAYFILKFQQPHGSKSQNRIVIIQNKENILTPFPFCDEKN